MFIDLVTNEQYARNGAAVSSYIRCFTADGNNVSPDILYQMCTLRSNWFESYQFSKSSIKDAIKDQLNWLKQYNDCDYVQNGWSYSLRSCIKVGMGNSSQSEYENSGFVGSEFEIKLFTDCNFTIDGVVQTFHFCYFYFKGVFPDYNTLVSNGGVIVSTVCPNDLSVNNTITTFPYTFTRNCLSISNPNASDFLQFNYTAYNPSPECDDIRSSSGTNECQISINYLDVDQIQQTSRYSLLFQPDSNHTSGSVSNIGWLPFSSIVGASCHFTGGNVRGSGIIIIRGHLYGFVEKSYSVGGEDIKYSDYIDENVILLQASFSPCCDYPDSYSETYTDILDDTLENIVDGDVYFLNCEVTSIEWSGFENLTDYCCDNSDCSTDDFEYPPNNGINTGGGEGGGGEGGGGEGGGTDPCVCEWLESIDTKLGLIDNSLSALLCICTSLDTLTSVLRSKELSVTNQITVTPSTAQITTPVNAPVTVNPPINQITVTPSTAQITTPVNAPVTVTPAPVTVNPTDLTGLISAINGLQLSASVTNNIDGLTCENSLGQQESLACILRDALNYSGEGLAQIHKKAFSFTDCCNIEFNLVDAFVKTDTSDCVDYTLVEEVHNLNDSVKLSSDEIIIENGLYSDVRKKYFQPFLSVDDSSIEDG